MILSSKGTDVAIVLFALYHGWSALDLVHTAMSAKCESVLHTKQTELRSLGTAVAVIAHLKCRHVLLVRTREAGRMHIVRLY